MHSKKVAIAVWSLTLLFDTCFGSRLNGPTVRLNRIGLQSADGGAPPAPPLPLPGGKFINA
jgi:hypothetical protein